MELDAGLPKELSSDGLLHELSAAGLLKGLSPDDFAAPNPPALANDENPDFVESDAPPKRLVVCWLEAKPA